MEDNEFARASCHRGPDTYNGQKNDEQYQKYHFLIILQENARSRDGTSANVAT